MGVESDQLVFDYLSRVGDLAQTALPAAQRMRLVARLRGDIERARREGDDPAAVRRILDRLGTPDEVVDAASGVIFGTAFGAPPGTGLEGPSGAFPTAPFGGALGRGGGAVPPPAPTEPPDGRHGPYVKPQAGPADADPDWWRVPPPGAGRPRAGDELAGLPGMTGGVTIPLDDGGLLKDGPQPLRGRPAPVPPAEAAPAESAEEAPAAAAATPGRWWPRLSGRKDTPARRWGSPALLLAAALLVAGAVLGSLIPMGLGWLLGYLSRALSRSQAKFGILGIPGAAGAGLLVWLWGRDAGKWSTPIAEGQVGHAALDALPATIRIAAIGSALYLLWRARHTA
ncbi:hypothetical protein [Actinacidiphila sp. ITFR-21]|uniref:hypothetical protein n=1 Tax=Actinacidiphila sp. ITFR-21 TaxID=3075199 RepID=UPI002888FDAF|nr:hypothetical protein [Streptomyces sp. ITFR-21]WNI16002.1 hypothetical protein RLT57_11020 [Streptomyces sp. ITFR-21]